MAGKEVPGSDATFKIAERRERGNTRSGRTYRRSTYQAPAEEPIPDPLSPAPRPAGSTPHHSGTLLQLGDLDTDSEDDGTTEQLLPQAALRQEQQVADLAAPLAAATASQAAQHPATQPQFARRQSIVEQVFGIRTPASQQHREQRPPGAFPGTPERPRGRTVERETPPPPPLLPPPENIMSAQGDAGPSKRPKIKLPQPAKFSGQGDNPKPDKLKGWFWEVRKYLSKPDGKDDKEDVVDYYCAFIEERAHKAYRTLLEEYDQVSPTLEQFKTRFKQLFEASTNTDDLYQKWQKVQQTTGGNPARISKIAGELADLKGALSRDSISDYAHRQRFLDAMDQRLCQNVEPQIRENNTWDHIVQLAERYHATMDKTRSYKGKGGNQNTGNKMQTPKRHDNNNITNTTPAKGKGKGKAPAKRKPAQENQKASKAEMDQRKTKAACFYCGEMGHMANKCSKKEVKSNHVRLSEETDSREGEYEAESDETEDLDGENSIITFKTTVEQPKNEKKPFQVLEFTTMVNSKPARALADTGTIGGTLLSNRFVTTNNIPYKPGKKPCESQDGGQGITIH